MIGLVTGDDGWAPTCMLGKREREWEEGVGSGGGGGYSRNEAFFLNYKTLPQAPCPLVWVTMTISG